MEQNNKIIEWFEIAKNKGDCPIKFTPSAMLAFEELVQKKVLSRSNTGGYGVYEYDKEFFKVVYKGTTSDRKCFLTHVGKKPSQFVVRKTRPKKASSVMNEEDYYNMYTGGVTYTTSGNKECNKWWGAKCTVILTPEVHQKMLFWSLAAKGEISGLGRVEKVGDFLYITDVAIMEQECTAGGTTLDEDALAKFMYEMIAKVGDDWDNWRFWWHSHNNFDVFWSGTDEDNAKRLSEGMFLVSTCINKFGDMTSRVDEKGVKSTGLITLVGEPSSVIGKIKRNCIKEVKEKVKNVKFRAVQSGKKKKSKKGKFSWIKK